MIGIEFGCGEKPTKPGFRTCDIRDVPGVDFVCPAWEIEHHVDANTVDEIFSRHFFEHVTFIQGEKVLQAWYNILKPGGKMEMMLPNMTFHINQWTTRSNIKHAKAGFWGWQREGEHNVWDVHKSGYDFELLEETLLKHKFYNIKSLRSKKDKHLHIECMKITA
jgi:predicted SAM-dependent methyltransferase